MKLLALQRFNDYYSGLRRPGSIALPFSTTAATGAYCGPGDPGVRLRKEGGERRLSGVPVVAFRVKTGSRHAGCGGRQPQRCPQSPQVDDL